MEIITLPKRFEWLYKFQGLTFASVVISVSVTLPIIVVISHGFLASSEVWDHLVDTVLISYLANSVLLTVMVSFGVILLGVPTAWTIAFYRFPGRALFSWLLLLPMAIPAYILAYTYTGILDYSGPVLTTLRQINAPQFLMTPFEEIRSLPGAAIMLSLVLYPYVYLLARAAFFGQSVNLIEVAQTLGQSRWTIIRTIVLPMARPAIAAGTLLAIMESLADFGTVQFFGVDTFTTGIVRTYYGFGDEAGAAQLSSILLGFVALLIFFERLNRHRGRYESDRQRTLSTKSEKLQGYKSLFALTLCAFPIVFGFFIPAITLLYWSIVYSEVQNIWILAAKSFGLAGVSAVIIVILSLVVCYASRLYQSRWTDSLVSCTGLGYALPGVVIAIGILIPFGAFDQWFSSKMILFGFPPSLWLSGTVLAVIFAYCVRFLAVANGNLLSGLSRIPKSLDQSARLLGRTESGVIRAIHIPLLKGSILTALLICFVDILKELPATLILRPFDLNTLAVKAYELASDERLIDAALPSIWIVVVGLIPVIWLNRAVR